ncbi:ATP-dependent nuclease [Lactococcus lactis]|uniref:ATP-dependent nuclease n=1 Tax=Lactococcus lactis TaxID=1358 RepID=UPI00288DE4BB|nr:AAA family ATPase [Lactococcus lactis]MDT2862674.1 AAA family ATPase [Lactococcus lactis]MDT2870984.1 AAA family ATPase [Lactococcus lactis]MDT2876098.1 AAA family ATPase [Lactococcus lactis]MDT2886658.1 AAA family ATPase [Lactococcus lactis]MDT2889905.1 AAA family ATPase [Lactococcus lactis]
MKFESIEVKNFRSFKDIRIKLSNKNIFFGMNDVGKTNLLTAFRFVFDREIRKRDFIDSDYFEKNIDNPIEITVCLDISENNENTAKLRPYVKGAILSKHQILYIKLIAHYDESELSGVAELYWGGDLENLKEIKSKGNRFEIDNIFNVFYIDSYVDMDMLFKRNIRKFIKSDYGNEEDRIINEEIDSIVSNLNEKISKLSGVSEFESKITPAYKKFNQEEISISVKSEIAIKGLFSNIVPYMKKNGNDNIYPTAGEGRKKLVVYSLFTLLAEQEAYKKINLFFVEETENNLHKSLQIELSQILFGDSGNYPFLFVTTHSPYILYEMDQVTLIRVFSNREVTSNSYFYKVPKEYQNNKKMMNRLLSEALFADKVLLVEGPSEQLLFDRVLSWKKPYYETKGVYILVVNGISFAKYQPILKKLGISYTIKTDNDIQWREYGCYALGFSRLNNLSKEKIGVKYIWSEGRAEDKKTFEKNSISYRKALYNEKIEDITNIQSKYHIFLSKVDLENDLDEVMHDKLIEIFGKDNPVKYLQGAKNDRMVELVEKLTDEDCETIYNHENFSCLKDMIE